MNSEMLIEAFKKAHNHHKIRVIIGVTRTKLYCYECDAGIEFNTLEGNDE